jgi:hypothetical protein
VSYVPSSYIEELSQRIEEAGAEHGVDTSALDRYVRYGLPPGGFLSAVLRNDFLGAAGRADDTNSRKLHAWASIIYNVVPHDCHGTAERVQEWIEKGGLEGREKSNASL